MQKRIVWQKYIQFGRDEDSLYESPKDLFKTPYEDGYEEPKKQVPILQTNLGLIPITEKVFCSYWIDLWVCHANFKLTPAMYQEVVKIDGIELAQVLSPHRLLLGFHKIPESDPDDPNNLFKTSDLKLCVEKVLLGNIPQTNTVLDKTLQVSLPENIREMIDQFKVKYKDCFWSIFVLPNNQVESFVSKNKEEVDARIALFQKTQMTVGGSIINYFDFNQ